METATKRYIDVTDEAMEKLARAFKCTEHFVYLALTYRKDSELARKLRHTALKEYGGVTMRHCPECETLHNITEDGRRLMVQNFDNGVKLEIDKETGAAVVYDRKGALLSTRRIEGIPELTELQKYAESL
jgi:hypothetical protein